MAAVEAAGEMSAVRRAICFTAVLLAAAPLAYTQVTWTPIYVGGYSEYPIIVIYSESCVILLHLLTKLIYNSNSNILSEDRPYSTVLISKTQILF